MAKYDRIGLGYDETRQADPYLASRLLHYLAPQTGGWYLDIGCGTGNYTHAIYTQSQSHFIGMDPSTHMLAKATDRNPDIDWRLGSAESTGLADASMDGIVASLTIHHWTDLGAGFHELTRVLKPDSPLVLFTATPEQMEGYLLNHYFPRMLQASIQQMPALSDVQTAMAAAGLRILEMEPYEIRPDLRDHFLYCGKQKPELYLDPVIRKGISSFSDLANQAEVTQGLAQLAQDMDNGTIEKITRSFSHDQGDYLFVKAAKAN